MSVKTSVQAAIPSGPISLAPGTEDAGLAAILADLLRQNLAQHPRKQRDFQKLRATISIEANDADVTVTLEFQRGSLVLHAGLVGAPAIRISADSETVLALSALRIVGGLPSLFDAGGRHLVGKFARGELRIQGLWHLVSLLRVTRLMSVNG